MIYNEILENYTYYEFLIKESQNNSDFFEAVCAAGKQKVFEFLFLNFSDYMYDSKIIGNACFSGNTDLV